MVWYDTLLQICEITGILKFTMFPTCKILWHLAENWLCLVPISAPPNASINKVRRKVVLLGSSYTKRTPPFGRSFNTASVTSVYTALGFSHAATAKFAPADLFRFTFPNAIGIHTFPKRFVNKLYWSEITEETKENIYHVHNYIGTGTIYKRNKQLQEITWCFFPLPSTNSALMWLPPQQCLRASAIIWSGFAISLSTSVGPKQTSVLHVN